MAKKKDKNQDNQQKKPIVFVNNTPKGEKKDVSTMLKEYHPPAVEAAWYDWWEKQGYFKPSKDKKEKFIIVLPPPNVTGTLHLGHALTTSIQDCLVRWHRMKGDCTLYVPGVDHAGIATQVVVEKQIMKEQQKTRHDLGREGFLKEVWKWKEQYGNQICNQIRRCGISLDWSRFAFTMDEQRSKAVTEAFIRLYEKGYIYRATRLVNWCCTLKTAISNIEVKRLDVKKATRLKVPGHTKKTYEFGVLIKFAYPVENSDKQIIVATTRLETMLGDTAVAVHPDDPRYKEFHGKYVIHPFNKRRIPIICDKILVDMSKGTGAVKITPAHDPNDFECGKRHNLEFINVFNDDGTINENGYPFTGMKRFDAREAVLKALDEMKLYKGKEDNEYALSLCSRSGDIIEPMIKPQWYCDCKELAAQSIEAVKKGDLKIIPNYHEQKWFEWLENIQDWCISRQLWWGHRIPAWFCNIEGQKAKREDQNYWIVAHNEQEAMELAKKKFGADKKIKLEQDEDVLDTWFSSGLFPFSTMGWPDDTQDLKDFYPNTILETGHDILFFWVARMVFMGLALTGKLPFKYVYLHAMVRDKYGDKMSKSKGNVIDPLDVVEGISLEDLHKKLDNSNLSPEEIAQGKKGQKLQFPKGIPECGTDALRFTLLNYTMGGRDINLDVQRIFGYRTFCNKLWQTISFALMHFTDFTPSNTLPGLDKDLKLSFIDKWILSRLNYTIKTVIQALEEYDFYTYTTACYDFWLKELCSVYLELIKPVMFADKSIKENAEKRKAAQTVLYTCVEQCLRLLHPAMPFITEDLWQRLPGHNKKPKELESIMINPFPKPVDEWTNEAVEKDMEVIRGVISKIRSVKAAYNLSNAKKPAVFVQVDTQELHNLIKSQISSIQTQSFCGDVTILSKDEPIPQGCAIEIVNPNCKAFISLKGMINIEQEIKKLQKKEGELSKAAQNIRNKMNDPQYDKVPDKVKQSNAERLAKYEGELKNVKMGLETLSKIKDS